ncbi:MAG: RraA family protein [Candidatus Dormibacteraeota bacterium]|nr:RraA family protein [Candidatus Dormibacteraeota bacterium]
MSAGPKGKDATLLEALGLYDSPTLSNAIETFDVRNRDEGYTNHEIRCMFPDLPPVVGYAATITVRSHEPPLHPLEPAQLWKHVQSIPSPRILVAEDLDEPKGIGAMWGEVQGTIFKALGCLAIVTDGVVRDLSEVRAMGLHYFARGATVSHAYAHFESAGISVSVGGLAVRPGDLIHADQHGVLLIPSEIADRLPAAADEIIAKERRLISWIRSADFDPGRLEEMRRVDH